MKETLFQELRRFRFHMKCKCVNIIAECGTSQLNKVHHSHHGLSLASPAAEFEAQLSYSFSNRIDKDWI